MTPFLRVAGVRAEKSEAEYMPEKHRFFGGSNAPATILGPLKLLLFRLKPPVEAALAANQL
jgi:hypothetical protein